MGYRYALHRSDLPGHPDIVFVRHKKIIFVHGCFWHRHNCKYGRVRPATRKRFWETKLNGNKIRDKYIRLQLRLLGWQILVLWECHTRNLPKLTASLQNFLKS
jgi:DNA mismatch endonuclease (patch repair protein)